MMYLRVVHAYVNSTAIALRLADSNYYLYSTLFDLWFTYRKSSKSRDLHHGQQTY